jgi:hypothetical protein
MDQVEGPIRIGCKAKNLHLEAFRCGGIHMAASFQHFDFISLYMYVHSSHGNCMREGESRRKSP